MMNPHEFFRKAAVNRQDQMRRFEGILMEGLRGPILPDTARPIAEATPLKPLYESAKHYHNQN